MAYELQVGVKALIPDGDSKFLFLRRSLALPDGGGIRWDIPGGRINPDESLIDALRRGVAEETRLTVVGSPHIINSQDIFFEDKNLHIVQNTYIADAIGEVSLTGEEHDLSTRASLTEAEELNVDDFLRQTLHSLY